MTPLPAPLLGVNRALRFAISVKRGISSSAGWGRLCPVKSTSQPAASGTEQGLQQRAGQVPPGAVLPLAISSRGQQWSQLGAPAAEVSPAPRVLGAALTVAGTRLPGAVPVPGAAHSARGLQLNVSCGLAFHL